MLNVVIILGSTGPGRNGEVVAEFGLESPEFGGRVISALYDDPVLLSLSGKTLLTAEIARHYGVTDFDGKKPKSLRAIYGGPHDAYNVLP